MFLNTFGVQLGRGQILDPDLKGQRHRSARRPRLGLDRRLTIDTAYGSAAMLEWVAHDQGTTAHPAPRYDPPRTSTAAP